MAVAQPDETSAESPRFASIEESFAALESPVLRYALRLLGDPSLAEDVVQEAFMRLHAQFDQVQQPRRWLYRTVHNLALNHRRDNAKIVALEPANEDGQGPTSELVDTQPLPDEQIARWEAIGLVRLTLDALDDRSRELVRLKFNEDLSYKEISARTGLKVGHVGYLLHHALKTVAVELAKTGVVP
jgi:RNA polymerase sigma-70 factor (ECF subfamily)